MFFLVCLFDTSVFYPNSTPKFSGTIHLLPQAARALFIYYLQSADAHCSSSTFSRPSHRSRHCLSSSLAQITGNKFFLRKDKYKSRLCRHRSQATNRGGAGTAVPRGRRRRQQRRSGTAGGCARRRRLGVRRRGHREELAGPVAGERESTWRGGRERGGEESV